MDNRKKLYWDVLFLKISTDPEGVAYARYMIDRDEAEVGVNIMRERYFNRDNIDLPEVVVTDRTDSTLSCKAWYPREEESALEFTLDLEGSPAIDIAIGTEEKPAWIGVEIVNIDDPVDDCDCDDDGRYDAWA